MTDDDKKSLVVADDADTPEQETLAEELGGFQALTLFIVIGLLALLLFAFPTPFNPATPPADGEQSILDTLGGLEVEVAQESTPTPTPEPDGPVINDVEGDSEVFEAEDQQEGTPVATATPMNEPTDEPTAEPTAEPTEVPPTEVPPTEEPTVEPTVEPTEVPPTEMPTEEASDDGETIASLIAAGDIAAGQTVFNSSYQTSSGGWMCMSCHSIDEAETRLVGPGLYNLYARVDERAQAAGDASAVEYVYNSIIAPAAYHVEAEPPYPENLMPANYEEVLTQEELDNVVAYILSIGNPDAP